MVVIFFFKQKTAYEMRISDWSSDVCSSDLKPNAEMEPAALLAAFMADLAAGRVQTGDGVAPIATCWLDAWRMAQAEAPRPRVASARPCLRHHHHPAPPAALGEHRPAERPVGKECGK